MTDNELLKNEHVDLIELQDVLRDKFALEAEIDALPKNLTAMKNELKEANIKYLDLTAKYNEAKDNAFTTSHKYDEAVMNRTDSEKKMDSITTQREYEALSKEIDEAKIREQNLLRARNATNKAVDELTGLLDAQAEIAEQLQKTVEEESAQIDAIVDEKKKLIAELEEKCAQISAANINSEIYAKFSNIVKNKNGVGIVPIHGQVCTGCHMILPVQFVNDVRSGNEIEYCPYCSRILYYEESEDALDIDALVADESQEENLSSLVDMDDFDL